MRQPPFHTANLLVNQNDDGQTPRVYFNGVAVDRADVIRLQAWLERFINNSKDEKHG
jgi:hypothetical protein